MRRSIINYPAVHAELLNNAQNVNRDDIESLYKGFERYIQLCGKIGLRVTNNGAYLALGVSRKTISAWITGTRRQSNPEYKRFAELVKQVCAAAREQYAIENLIDYRLAIFWEKIFDGFTDTPAREDVRDPLGALPDKEQLAKMMEKYADEKT